MSRGRESRIRGQKGGFDPLGVRAEKIVDWGYFVKGGRGNRERGTGPDLKIL